mmetsp:Transcript_27080/g.88535  ORF Transcript_27080/g.88535 Transcript_27080/m.88535 type:complete len:91 (-) Transcript_27080:41-313(-)
MSSSEEDCWRAASSARFLSEETPSELATILGCQRRHARDLNDFKGIFGLTQNDELAKESGKRFEDKGAKEVLPWRRRRRRRTLEDAKDIE